MSIWVIYEHPLDFPNSFVVRRQFVYRGQIFKDTRYVLAPTLEEARKRIPPWLHCLPRQEGDDPVIVECWL